MSASTGKTVPAIGFLTVTEHPEHGLFGGYLILNVSGRPLEFHCTAPVKPSRAQEILYGATLRPFLYGEQIGQTLLTKAKVTPLLVCTDALPMLSAREFSQQPLLLVHPSVEHGTVNRDDSCSFLLGKNRVSTSASSLGDREVVMDHWRSAHADALDLLEPFVRIREALEEAQKTVRPATTPAAA